MEEMVKKICLDTDVLISLFKKDETTKKLLESLGEIIFATTSVNIFELWFGRKEQEGTSELIESLEIFNFDKTSAKISADILRVLKKQGQLLEFRDVFMASICIKNNLELLTLNKKHFNRLKKLGLILI